MKILVTGYKGFIGKNLVDYLIDKGGHTVEGFEWGDSDFPQIEGYDTVIHLGAISTTTERDVDKIMTQNYEFSYKLLMACNQHKVDMHYASSASVYGPGNDGFSETAPPAPMNPYAWSKYLFDRLVLKSIDSLQINVYGFRYFNVFGPNEDHKGAQASLWSKWRGKGPHDLFKESDSVFRDFIHVEDVCNIHNHFLTQPPTPGIYNIGTGKATSIGKVASTYKDTEFNIIPMPSELKGQYQYYTRADNTKLMNVLGKYVFKDFVQ